MGNTKSEFPLKCVALGQSLPHPIFRDLVRRRYMRKLQSISVILAAAVATFAPVSLFARVPVLPNDSLITGSSQTAQPLPSGKDQPQPANQSQTGIILGTVTDMNDAPVSGAIVALRGSDDGEVRSVTTNESGFFEIRDVEAGRTYGVSIRAPGFDEWDSPAVTLDPGQSKILDVDKLRIEEVQTVITVTPESVEEIATEQVKTAEKQRGFGIIPNFYAVYESNPVPLTTKLKFSLSLKVARDPFTLAGVAMLAGVGQAANNPNYVQGAKGYGERFGADYANSLTDILFDGAILPSLLHQDPRYFYQGAGSTKSRAIHALASLVIARGDNGRLQPNYSSLGGDLASAAISNLYYPRSQRGVALLFQGFAINTAIHASVRLLDEFVFRPSGTTPVHLSRKNDGKA